MLSDVRPDLEVRGAVWSRLGAQLIDQTYSC